jgi:hypothetical protein
VLLYLVAAEHERRHEGVRVVRYEDLAAEPVPAFAELFGWLGLRFDQGAERAVVRSTTGGARRRAHTWSLSKSGLSKTGYRPMDSRANLTAWQRQLTAGEVARVRAVTAEVAGRWYQRSANDESDPGGQEP